MKQVCGNTNLQLEDASISSRQEVFDMKILLVHDTLIPVFAYGGTERAIWALGKELAKMGHEVTFLVRPGSTCPFARVLPLDMQKPLAAQIPGDVDVVHFLFEIDEAIPKPYIITLQGNSGQPKTFDPNTVFVSRNHAERHGATAFVYNGIDLDDYGKPDVSNPRKYFHFLAKAAWRVKNVRGAIEITTRAGERLHVIGGYRLNFNMGFRLTLSPRVRFHGMLGGEEKNEVMRSSKGLIFPVLWHEPFGIAIIESLYFGCPVFATPYGSLPELLNCRAGEKSEFGFLSAKKSELVEAVKAVGDYDRQRCQDYVAEHFSALQMTKNYLKLYEQVLNGKPLHDKAPEMKEVQKEKFLPFD
jgi:glycosyltransferase involved in cell wall biosynthesis